MAEDQEGASGAERTKRAEQDPSFARTITAIQSDPMQREPAPDAAAAPALVSSASEGSMPSVQVGSTIKHYEIIRKLGEGGMGAVFLARVTHHGQLVGTLPYMSPEQWRCEELDARSDLWAVGVILYELCVGAHPLGALTMHDLMPVQDLDRPMPSVSQERPDVGALGAVIDKCLRKRKAERFASAEELLAALEPLLPGKKALTLGEDENPFAGLAALQESDAGRFFGREREVATVLGRLRNQRLVAVAGPSGAGKSSFVRAGVIPALKRSGERWETFILRPGRGPLAALAEVLAQVPDPAQPTPDGGPTSLPDPGDLDAVVSRFRTQPGLLGARLRARCREQGGRHRVLLFVDQFEELAFAVAHSEVALAVLAHLDVVNDVAWSPDGKRIVTTSFDTTARVWSADGTGEPLVLRGHEREVNSAAWSPDGTRIVTASDDTTARVWTDLAEIRGSDDPRLWTGTTYCLTVERRMKLLSVSEASARADEQACRRRVEATRAAPRLE